MKKVKIQALVQRVPHQRKRAGVANTPPGTYVRFTYKCKPTVSVVRLKRRPDDQDLSIRMYKARAIAKSLASAARSLFARRDIGIHSSGKIQLGGLLWRGATTTPSTFVRVLRQHGRDAKLWEESYAKTTTTVAT